LHFLDWLIVIGLNGAIIAFGFCLARGVTSSTEWFLAGRQLPWWMVGLSMYATAIDASDLVADSGGTYTIGFTYFVANMVGTTCGWGLAAFFVFLPMYRAGMYTNAEYLEARFGPVTRALCALVQVQYRTAVLGIIGMSLFWTLNVVCGWPYLQCMLAIAGVALFASIYTACGGLKSVAITDVLQFGVMTVAAVVIWLFVFNGLGGWSGIEAKLTAAGHEKLLHVDHEDIAAEDVSELSQQEVDRKLLLGGTLEERDGMKQIVRATPGWLVVLGLFIIGMAYPIVNHTQSMRMFAAKSEWDFRMCVSVAGFAMVLMSFFNLSMGVLGRAWMPDQTELPGGNQDQIYPWMVSQMDIIGLQGLVVAGIFAAAFSTYDSIGSSLSALLTRDLYARFVVRDRDDHHYLRVGQWLTPAVIAVSFAYIPFLLKGGMLLFFLDLTSAFVIPLLTLFLMGPFTRVHRRSGTYGLLAGACYGILRLAAPLIAAKWGVAILPPVMLNTYAAYPMAMLITAAAMLVTSLWTGWQPCDESAIDSHQEQSKWLKPSQQAIRSLEQTSGHRSAILPAILAITVVGIGCSICFILFW